MSKASPVHNDPRVLRPIIEALIFASEEPLAPRLLVRLLAGEREEPRTKANAGSVVTDADVDADALSTEPTMNASMNGSSGADDVDETTFAGAATQSGSQDEVDNVIADDTDVSFDGEAESGSQNPNDLATAFSDLLSDEPVQEIDQRLVRRLVDDLNNAYEETGRAFRIVEVAGGFQFATIRDFGEYVALLSKEKLRRRLSPAALETLAIIAFRQPISKPEIEAIRGVNSDQVLLSLLEKNLVCITGRSESVGRPLLYGSSEDFLRIFGLNSLSDLPKLREIEELMEDNAYSAERIEVVTVPLSSDAEEIEAMVGAAGHSEDVSRDGEEVNDGAFDDSVARQYITNDADSDDAFAEDGDSADAAVADDADGDDVDAADADEDVDDSSNSNAGIDIEWVEEVGAIGEDDAGMTLDNESHVLDEVEAIDADDDAYDTTKFTIGPDDASTESAMAHNEHESDGATRPD